MVVQASLLVRHPPSFVADAFVASRAAPRPGASPQADTGSPV